MKHLGIYDFTLYYTQLLFVSEIQPVSISCVQYDSWYSGDVY